MLPSLLKRQGGKYAYRKRIIEEFPTDYDTYVEPFIGGGSILLNAPVVDRMYGSDTDPLVIETFQLMKKIPADVIKQFDLAGSEKRFYKMKEYEPKTEAEKLYKILYLNKNSFMGKSSYPDGGLEKRTGQNFHRNVERIKERLKHIKISKMDYKTAIKKHDSPTTFFYLDPPYYNTDVSSYETGNIDHQELREILGKTEGRWLLSHNDTKFIRELYKGFNIKKFATRQVDIEGGTKKTKEVLISNY